MDPSYLQTQSTVLVCVLGTCPLNMLSCHHFHLYFFWSGGYLKDQDHIYFWYEIIEIPSISYSWYIISWRAFNDYITVKSIFQIPHTPLSRSITLRVIILSITSRFLNYPSAPSKRKIDIPDSKRNNILITIHAFLQITSQYLTLHAFTLTFPTQVSQGACPLLPSPLAPLIALIDIFV